MEIAGFIYIGNRYRCSRDSPTLLVIGELFSEQSTKKLAQEPRITAYISQDEKMIQSFKDGKDIYGSIASIAFGVPYEQCLEFNPETGEYQPEGKARRGEAKTIVLGRPHRF